MKSRRKKPHMPRVLIRRDISTKVILSRKDKANSRRSLNLDTKNQADMA